VTTPPTTDWDAERNTAAGDEGGEAPCFAHLLADHVEPTDHDLADLVRQLADAVVIADSNGVITFWNDAATRIFGWSSAEAVGRSLDLIIPERLRERHWAGYRQTMASGHTSYGDRLLEVPALHRDGHTVSIAFTVTLLFSGATTPRAIAAVLRDDTERWQERRRLRAELANLRGGAQPVAG
jgi:PAS domain S-box-containing protein